MGSNKNENYYRTSDMALATVLSLTHVIEDVDRRDPRRATFKFRHTADLNKVVDMYWKHELRIDPLQFFNQLKLLKSRLYGEE